MKESLDKGEKKSGVQELREFLSTADHEKGDLAQLVERCPLCQGHRSEVRVPSILSTK